MTLHCELRSHEWKYFLYASMSWGLRNGIKKGKKSQDILMLEF